MARLLFILLVMCVLPIHSLSAQPGETMICLSFQQDINWNPLKSYEEQLNIKLIQKDLDILLKNKIIYKMDKKASEKTLGTKYVINVQKMKVLLQILNKNSAIKNKLIKYNITKVKPKL